MTVIFFYFKHKSQYFIPRYLVIVCANLTANAVILKRLSKGLQIYSNLLIDFCNDYRPYLC